MRFILPLAPGSRGIPDSGSMYRTLLSVPHLIAICSVLLMKYTSQWNGVFSPVERESAAPSFGMFCVSSVYRPGPNRSSACPFIKKIASCDS